MYKDKKIILITNFKKSEKLFNFQIIHHINWGSIKLISNLQGNSN